MIAYQVETPDGRVVAEAEGYENAAFAAVTVANEDNYLRLDVITGGLLTAMVVGGRLVEWGHARKER